MANSKLYKTLFPYLKHYYIENCLKLYFISIKN
jgi:hypothetical protein